MSSKLDEISEAIGRLRAGIVDLQRQAKESRKLQERRHVDNSAALRDLAEKLDRHAASVETMRPTVAALELSRSKLATWATAGFAIFVVFGWLAEAALKWLVDRALSHFQ
jgi:hypothetical protein